MCPPPQAHTHDRCCFAALWAFHRGLLGANAAPPGLDVPCRPGPSLPPFHGAVRRLLPGAGR